MCSGYLNPSIAPKANASQRVLGTRTYPITGYGYSRVFRPGTRYPAASEIHPFSLPEPATSVNPGWTRDACRFVPLPPPRNNLFVDCRPRARITSVARACLREPHPMRALDTLPACARDRVRAFLLCIALDPDAAAPRAVDVAHLPNGCGSRWSTRVSRVERSSIGGASAEACSPPLLASLDAPPIVDASEGDGIEIARPKPSSCDGANDSASDRCDLPPEASTHARKAAPRSRGSRPRVDVTGPPVDARNAGTERTLEKLSMGAPRQRHEQEIAAGLGVDVRTLFPVSDAALR
jgi:hypothetical protein